MIEGTRQPTPEALLPCPFCGVLPVLEGFRDRESGYDFYQIRCENSDCAFEPMSDGGDAPQEAARKWNTRADKTTELEEQIGLQAEEMSNE